jgi:chitodextrinase
VVTKKLLSLLAAIAMVAALVALQLPWAQQPAEAAVATQLTRYPYLTDVVESYATINWGTDRSATHGSVTYGRVGSESCTAHKVSASRKGFKANGVSEYQWKAKLSNLVPNAQYCYRVFLGPVDLLGSDASPKFWSQIPAGTTTPFSFGVIGDWGDTDANGANPSEAALMSSLASSGVRFVIGTGDTGYDGGTQTNYGDLQQTGYRISSVFGPDFWAKVGATTPMFNAVGNHGANATFFSNWPQDRAVANSNGVYKMENYCCVNGTTSHKEPSAWYAFDVGNARFYMLTSTWRSSNVGTSDEYGDDYAARWDSKSPEYQWLKADLNSHPSQLKFAIFHYPLYSVNATETSDTYLQGTQSLEGLLARSGVNIAFNGHAHLYQRNGPTLQGLVSYISGGGGATPEPATKCNNVPNVQYALGWSGSKSSGSACGSAPTPTDVNQVFHYLKVDVDGSAVTVSGVNALGQVFDSVQYDFGADSTPPTAPTNLQATAPAGNRVDLTWDAATDLNGIASYQVYRDGNLIDSVDGATTSYTDLTVSQNTPYSYTVTATDPTGNISDPSLPADVTTPSLDQQAPDPPSTLTATAPDGHHVSLAWAAANDNVGVTGYDIYRDGSLLDSVDGATTAYIDATVQPATPYAYTVRARDAAGNISIDSPEADVTTPSVDVVFSDDFMSGMSAWSFVQGITTTQDATAPSGDTWVAEQSSASAGGTYAYATVSPTSELYAWFRFKVVSRSTSVDLMRFRNGSGGSKFSLLVSKTTDTLAARDNGGHTTKSSALIANGTWHTVEVHVATPDTIEIWLDGVHLTELDTTGSVGTTRIGQFLLGNTSSGTYDVVFDDVIVATNQI